MTGGDITLGSNTVNSLESIAESHFFFLLKFSLEPFIQILSESRTSVVNTPVPVDRYPYDKYTILLGDTRALAHLGTHFTHRVISLSVNRMFQKQIGLTMEVYIDDMLVKSTTAELHIAHPFEAF